MTRRGLVDTVEADAMQVFVQMHTHSNAHRWTWFHTWLALLLYWPVCFSFIGGAGNGIQCISQGGI